MTTKCEITVFDNTTLKYRKCKNNYKFNISYCKKCYYVHFNQLYTNI